jgi:hypothetical protein
MSRLHFSAILFVFLGGAVAASATRSSTEGVDLPPRPTGAHRAVGSLPILFVANAGQTDARVRYVARGPSYVLHLAANEAVFDFAPTESRRDADARSARSETARGVALRLGFIGANPAPRVQGRRQTSARVNYIIGNDPERWHQALSTYREVVYRDLWPGIDMRFRTTRGQLEYRFILRPGAHVEDIRLAYAGADGVTLAADGDLSVRTPAGTLTNARPFSYQHVEGRRAAIESRFVVHEGGDGPATYGFALAGNVDPARSIVIDPSLVYSTYLGGSGQDAGFGIAVDDAGHAYVTGVTQSTDFPTTAGAYAVANAGSSDAFVVKFGDTGTSLLYATYLGGSGADSGTEIVLDASGAAYVSGGTSSVDFPTTPGAFDTTYNGGGEDAFVAKLDPTSGALTYSTYLGGASDDRALSIAVDVTGSAYVAGETKSSDFPTTPTAFDVSFNGGISDAFVTKIDTTGSTLVYSTYLGGSGGMEDIAAAIAVDPQGEAVVTGQTDSVSFPTTAAAYDPSFNGVVDCFVAKLDATGSALIYSTYLGDAAHGSGVVDVDAAGSAYVAGTCSGDFQPRPARADTSLGGCDAFVTKLDLTEACFSFDVSRRRIGRPERFRERPRIDATGAAYVAGQTACTDFRPPPTPSNPCRPAASACSSASSTPRALRSSTPRTSVWGSRRPSPRTAPRPT